MSETNPTTAAVAERLYEFVRTRELATNFKSTVGPSPWIALSDDLRASWRRQAEQLIQPMLDAAAEAYSRSGNQVLPEHLDVETGEVAERVGHRFADWRRAFRSSTEEHVGFPNHAVSAGLAAVAALRAAFGWSPTKTAPEIVDDMRPGEVQTEAGDPLRLHLASAHAYPVALGAGDGEAEILHHNLHIRGESEYPHEVTDLGWSEDEARNTIEVLHEKGYPRDQFIRPLRDHLDRAPHTADYDTMRLHLLSAHCLVNAAELRDHEVADAHQHEHDGPGTIRNHSRHDLFWTVDKVHDVLDDVRGEPEEHARYLRATDDVMARLKERTG